MDICGEIFTCCSQYHDDLICHYGILIRNAKEFSEFELTNMVIRKWK